MESPRVPTSAETPNSSTTPSTPLEYPPAHRHLRDQSATLTFGTERIWSHDRTFRLLAKQVMYHFFHICQFRGLSRSSGANIMYIGRWSYELVLALASACSSVSHTLSEACSSSAGCGFCVDDVSESIFFSTCAGSSLSTICSMTDDQGMRITRSRGMRDLGNM